MKEESKNIKLELGDVSLNKELGIYYIDMSPAIIHYKSNLYGGGFDKNGVPITNLYYKKSKETLNSAKTILVELGKLFVEKDIGRIALKSEIENLDSYENLGVHHHMGGTRIGNNFKTSVVDSNLKLHDLKNCYILGSSVFPTSGYTNPTFTIIQLSLRLGEFLSKKITM